MFENHFTVDVAEATGLALLGVMQTTGPVDGDVALLAVESGGTLHGSARTDATEFEKAIEDGTIVADIVLSLLARITVHVVGRDPSKEINVFVGVELCHLVDNCGLCALHRIVASVSGRTRTLLRRPGRVLVTYINLEEFVNVVVHDQAVGQSNAMRLHGMARNVRIIANIGVVKVGDLLLVGAQLLVERTVAINPGGVFGAGRSIHCRCEARKGPSSSRAQHV